MLPCGIFNIYVYNDKYDCRTVNMIVEKEI